MLKRTTARATHYGIPAGALAMLLSCAVLASTFVPYPGKREATLSRVAEPNLVFLTFDTDAAGFMRTLGIRMPGIVVARDTPQADPCEREAAGRAMAFVETFLAQAKKITIQDVRMDNAADEQAVSPIFTDKGSLSAAMIEEGVARPDSVDPKMSWCK